MTPRLRPVPVDACWPANRSTLVHPPARLPCCDSPGRGKYPVAFSCVWPASTAHKPCQLTPLANTPLANTQLAHSGMCERLSVSVPAAVLPQGPKRPLPDHQCSMVIICALVLVWSRALCPHMAWPIGWSRRGGAEWGQDQVVRKYANTCN